LLYKDAQRRQNKLRETNLSASKASLATSETQNSEVSTKTTSSSGQYLVNHFTRQLKKTMKIIDPHNLGKLTYLNLSMCFFFNYCV
jgi:hypothetical protein